MHFLTFDPNSIVDIGSPQWKQIIVDGARQFALTLDEATVEKFAVHASELVKWNRKINLTAITDPREMAVKHYLDAIAPIRFLPRADSLLDIGSGGGFPGIPLKILMPGLFVTLIDASRKKIGFLTHVGRLLELGRFQAVHIRAEELARRHRDPKGQAAVESSVAASFGNRIDSLPASFNLIVTRALASIDKLVALGMPILAKGGMMVAFKGRLAEEEIDRGGLSLMGISVTVHRYELPYLDIKRSLVFLHRSGKPAKKSFGNSA